MDEAGIQYFYYDLQTDSMLTAVFSPDTLVNVVVGPIGYERAGPQCVDMPAAPLPSIPEAFKDVARILQGQSVGNAISALHAQRCSNGLPNRYEVDHD